MVTGGEIYKSPFKIQSRKRSTKLILTQSVDQTKLNKPTRPSSTTMITPPKTAVVEVVKIIEIMAPCHWYNNTEHQQL